MRRLLSGLVLLGLIGFAGFWLITKPKALDPAALAGLVPDVAHGEQVFWAGGCASCHANEKAKGDDRLVLEGGNRLASPFGNFVTPNISNDPVAGIGSWTALDLANAMHFGTSPEGEHYFPAFPYTSYVRADLQDIVDLRAYLATLPASPRANEPHEVPFPFNIRLSLGGWKMLFVNADWVVTGDLSDSEARGRYLAEALGHCGECHTPRNALGGSKRGRWLDGAPDPSGKGVIPNITPGKLAWSEADLVSYLKSGFTPDFDVAGGLMAHVIQNLAMLPESDRAAIAAYLKIVPPVP